MIDVDLVVAGAGGGLVGALRAAELGERVLVVETNEHFLRGSNTAMSTAMIPAVGSRFQRAQAVADSVQLFLDDIARKTAGQADQRLAAALARSSAALVEWLCDYVGLPIELPMDFRYPGHSVQRLHSIPGRSGGNLLRGLYAAVRATEAVDLLIPSSLTGLRSSSGCWLATVTSPDGQQESVSTRAVLLASNGFGGDRKLVSRYLPEIANATYHGSEHSTGDALRLGSELGGRTGFLDAYQGHAGLSSTARTLVTWTAIMHGAIMTNLSGRRFGDETSGYSEFAALLAAQPGAEGWMVLDERIHRLCSAFDDYQDVDAAGALLTTESLGELAERTRMDAAALALEMSEVDYVVSGDQESDRFGRSDFEAVLRPPYRAVRVQPALFHTQGGLVVDEHARVLGSAGPIEGLYASGGAAIGISGHGADGYLAGNGLLPALGLAYLAAEHLAGTEYEQGEG